MKTGVRKLRRSAPSHKSLDKKRGGGDVFTHNRRKEWEDEKMEREKD